MICPNCASDNIQGEDLCVNCGLDLAGLDVQAWGVSPQDPLLARRLRDLKIKRALVLLPGATVAESLELMIAEHEGCVFVVDDKGGVVGVVTERDIALRVVARGRDPEKTPLAEVMTPSPFTLRPNDKLAFALHRMGVDGYRHLPVVEGERLIGFLSMRTVLQVLAEA